MCKKICGIVGLISIAALIFFSLPYHNSRALPLIDEERLEILKECAKNNTKQLNKVTLKDISRVEDFYRNVLKNMGLPISLFSYEPSWLPWTKGHWKLSSLNSGNKNTCENLLKWLNEHYHTRHPFKFFYLSQEPYLSGGRCNESVQEQFLAVIQNCPLLISCTHPDLEWTSKCVLIPDPWLLSQEIQDQIKSLVNSTIFLPFSKRKPVFYFRGALSGPKLPQKFETMKFNQRHLLLKKVKLWSFLDYKVTNFGSLYSPEQACSDYKEHILKNYSHLKGESVDFFEHAKHKYLLSFDGYGAAWGRVPMILATGSVLVLNAACQQYFYNLMVTNETHVTIKSDLSDGEQVYHDLEQDSKRAERIGAQGRNFAKLFLTKDAVDTYLWLALKEVENAYQ